jgi:hypothetical protein
MGLRMAFLWSMIVSLSLTALLGIVALILPRVGPQEEILGSTGVFAAFSLVAMLCAAVLERRRLARLMWVGIASSCAATVAWLVMIWFHRWLTGDVDDNVIRAGGTFSVIAIGSALVGLLALPRFDQRGPDIVRWTTVGVAAVLGAYIAFLLWWFDWIDNYIDEDTLMRTLGVLSILAACGSVVTPILWKVQAVRRAIEKVPLKIRIGVECPRCHTQQMLTTGPARCGKCGLHITVTVEEPRCGCGYPLCHLESDVCPECGRRIREEDRWADAVMVI